MKTQQWVWDATWKNGELDPKVQLFSAADLRRARIKAEKFQKEEQFDGELISLVRRSDIVL